MRAEGEKCNQGRDGSKERKEWRDGHKTIQGGQWETVSDVELTGFYQHAPLPKGSPSSVMLGLCSHEITF